MPGFNGTGPRGMGPMTGGGRGFCAIPLHAPSWRIPYQAVPPVAPGVTRERELELLKGEAQALKEELKGVESRIAQLAEKKK